MRLKLWLCLVIFVFLNASKTISAASVTDEFVVEEIANSSLPTAASEDAYIVVAGRGKFCFAYRNKAETDVIFGFGELGLLQYNQVALLPTERFTVATRSSGSCQFFYTKIKVSSFELYALGEDGNASAPGQFNRSPDVTYTMNAILDPTALPSSPNIFIIGFSFAEGISVKFAMIRYSSDTSSDGFSDIALDNPFVSDNPVKRLNFHQYGSKNLSMVAQLTASPQLWWGIIQPEPLSNFDAINSLPLTNVVGLTSQAMSADDGVLCFTTLGQVSCYDWTPGTSEIVRGSFHSENIFSGSNAALSVIRGNAASVLFVMDDISRVFAVQFEGAKEVSRNELPLSADRQFFAASNADGSNRLYMLVRNATGDMQLVRVRHDFCGDNSQNSGEQCDGGPGCFPNCTLITGIPVATNPEGRTPLSTSPVDSNNTGPSDPGDVPISMIVPAVVVPVVVVAAGLIVLLLLLRRRKKRNGSLLHGKSRVEIAMESIDDRLKIPYKSLVFKKEIGAGSYGKVYVGEWKGTPVAIKVSSSVSDMDGFFDEARITVGLQQHPNVVQTFGVSLDGQLPCIVLEFCEGGSLDNRLFDSDVTMTQPQKIALVKGIARGLYHLHTNNIVHRDLAARNVLLNKSGTPKISDFGMSRVLKSEAEKGKTKTNYGPIRWMSPESLKDLQYSTKSDVWSFGIVLYEIVSRHEPHIDIDPLEVAVKIKNEAYHPSVPQGVDPVLRELMLSCWQADPNNRPSMEQICNKLNSAFPDD